MILDLERAGALLVHELAQFLWARGYRIEPADERGIHAVVPAEPDPQRPASKAYSPPSEDRRRKRGGDDHE